MDKGSSIPRAKHCNGIQIWMLGCTMMVIAALAEYGIILFIKFIAENHTKMENKNKNGVKPKLKDDNEHMYPKQHNANNNTDVDSEILAKSRCLFARDKKENGDNPEFINNVSDYRIIDFVSLIVFPIAFLIFVMGYCVSF